jgi:hypothetical protein
MLALPVNNTTFLISFAFFRQELCEQLVKRYLARRDLNEMKKDADTGMLHAIESSKTEIKQTLEDMKQFIKLHKKN